MKTSVSVGRLCLCPMDDGLSCIIQVRQDGAMYSLHTELDSMEICNFACGGVSAFNHWHYDEQARYEVEQILGRPPASEDEFMMTAQMSLDNSYLPENPEDWLWHELLPLSVDGKPEADEEKAPRILPKELRPSVAEIAEVCNRMVEQNPSLSLACSGNLS